MQPDVHKSNTNVGMRRIFINFKYSLLFSIESIRNLFYDMNYNKREIIFFDNLKKIIFPMEVLVLHYEFNRKEIVFS